MPAWRWKGIKTDYFPPHLFPLFIFLGGGGIWFWLQCHNPCYICISECKKKKKKTKIYLKIFSQKNNNNWVGFCWLCKNLFSLYKWNSSWDVSFFCLFSSTRGQTCLPSVTGPCCRTGKEHTFFQGKERWGGKSVLCSQCDAERRNQEAGSSRTHLPRAHLYSHGPSVTFCTCNAS